uniref:Anthranilate N-benzoyltransferase protein 1 n=1 Tax=Aegilops tauschii TaxID=37682 RepID=M8D1Z2_AEGTA
MEVHVLSSKLVKPASTKLAAGAPEYIPLSVFDKVTYQMHMAMIFAFAAPAPAPTAAALEKGLAVALSEYRTLAGQLVRNRSEGPGVLLNDRGARVGEACVDADMVDVDVALPNPKPELLQLLPDLEEEAIKEVVVLQLTRFRCGSLAVGFARNHAVAGGRATSNFLVAWGRATRGLTMGLPPMYKYNHLDLFQPRPSHCIHEFEFDHRNREYYLPPPPAPAPTATAGDKKVIVVHKAHFSKDWIAGLRDTTSQGRDRPFTRFETILAQLWRAMTRARGLSQDDISTVRISVDGRSRLGMPAEYASNLVLWAFPRARVSDLLGQPLSHAAQLIHDEDDISTVRISVDGRSRLGMPAEYASNLVLWAFPRARVSDLLGQPLSHAAQLIHDEVARVADPAYFRSFVDFATSGLVEQEGLAPSSEINMRDVLCPDLEVHSWLTFQFYDMDFGTGTPTYVMPSYIPAEGLIFLAPSYIGDGSIDAFVPVFQDNLEAFKQCLYSIDHHDKE